MLPELTRADRDVLAVLLWRAGRSGEGEGCEPCEAMLWRRQGGIATDARTSSGSVKRGLAKLRGLGLVRWRVVDERQRLPTGVRADLRCTVFYVHVAKLDALLGTGTNQARKDHSDPFERIIAPTTAPGNPEKSAAPATSISGVNSVVKFNKPTTWNTAHPPQVVVVDSISTGETETIVEAAFAEWYGRIGAAHQASTWICDGVRDALRGAIGKGLTLEDLRDVIAGASDPCLGGDAYRYCQERNVWKGNLFFNTRAQRVSGCVEYLLPMVRAARARAESAANARRAPQPPLERAASPEETLRHVREALSALEGSCAPDGASASAGADGGG